MRIFSIILADDEQQILYGMKKGIEWENIVYAASGFMTVIFMILAYSISNGIAIGFITYTVSMIGVGKIKEIKPIVWILDICFVIFLVFLPK